MPRLLVLLVAWCTAASWATTASHLGTVDASGHPVRPATGSPRIVTLSPHATDLVVAAGAAERLVAIASGHAPPEPLRDLPRVGGAGPIDRERLLALAPDLVIAWLSGNRRSDLAWIRDSGIALYASEPRRLADVAHDIRAVGRLAGSIAAAELAAAGFLRTLDTPCLALPPTPVYVSVWEHPAMTLGGRHWLNDVLHHAGFRNVLADQPAAVMRIAAEDALELRALPRVSLQRGPDGSDDDRLADLLSRPGPGLAEAVTTLCRRRLASP